MFKKLIFALRKFSVAYAALVLLVPDLAYSQSLTIQGRVQTSAGVALNGSGTEFRVKILTPNANRCVLFDETYVVDLSQSSGLFSINLGTGLRTTNPSGNYSLDDAISNAKALSVNASYCDPAAGGSGMISYSPSATDNRKMIIQFRDASAGMSSFDTIPEMDMNPVAYAMEARTVGGFAPTSILRVANSGIPGVAPIMNDAQITELQALVGGSSTNYMSTTSGSTTGARLPSVSGNPSSPAAGSIWFDTSGSGAIKYFDSSGVIQTLGTGTGSGTITGVTAGTGLSGGGTSGAVTLSLNTSGVAASTYGSGGSVPVIQVDTYGRITSASSTPITGTLPSGIAGQFLRSNGTAWSSQKILLSDLKSSIGAADLFSAPGCSPSQALSWDSITDQIKCQNISLPGSAITGTIAAAQLPAFTGGDVTAAAGSTALTLPNVVAANTYKSVTVDAKGRVTAGTNPTTLAGYGITDSLVANGGGVPTVKAGLYSALPAFGNVGNLFISTDTLTLYRDNGAGWDIVGAAGAGSSLSGVTAGTGLTGGGTSGNVTLNLASVGTAGTYFKVGTDAQGRVTSGANALIAADIPNLDWAKIASGRPTSLAGYGITDPLVANAGGAISFSSGLASARPSSGFTAGRFYVSTDTKAIAYDNGTAWVDIVNASGGTNFSGSLSGDVTGTQGATVVATVGSQTAANVAAGAVLANAAVSANTINAIVKRDGSGGFSAGAVSQGSAVFRDGTTNTISMAAPSSVTSYNLTLPPAKASSAGQLLASDTSGVLSWVSPAASTTVGVTAPVTLGGTASAPVIGMPAATASVDGFLSAANFTAFTNKLSSALTSAYLFVGNAGGTATGVALSGDATLTNTGSLTVTGIRGKSVTAAPTAAGQILRYTGTAFDPTFISIRDMRSSLTGVNTLGATCTASQTLTWDSVGDVLTCSNIAINASAITAGILPIANGGTGANSVAQNLIFASPSGSTGAPAFRALAASDLPASASFWQAGTPGINYGGGNVGIGTNAPLDLLHVQAASGTNALMGVQSGSNSYWAMQGNTATNSLSIGPLASTHSVSQYFNITGGGNVGFGTTNPGYKLHVYSTTSSDGIALDGTNAPAITLKNAGSTVGVIGVATAFGLWDNAAATGDLVYRTSGGAIRFNTNTGAGTSALTILGANGYVGIGSTTPARPLDVNGSARLGAGASLEWGGTTTSIAGGSNTIQFQTASTERMRVDSAGNLGIGTTAPSALLHTAGVSEAYLVTDSGAKTAAIRLDSSNVPAGAGGSVEFAAAGKYFAAIKSIVLNAGGNGVGDLAFFTRQGTSATALTERMRIDLNGNVGIGTTAPTSALQVNGVVTATGFVGPVTSSSAGTAAGYTINSDSDSAGSDGGVNIQVRGNTKLAVTDGGKVSVGGEAAPASLLSNTSTNSTDAGGTGIAATGISWLSNAVGYVQALTNSSAATGANGLLVKVAGTAATNRILNLNASGTDVMTVTGAGNLGMGTSGPLARLHIGPDGNNRSSGIQMGDGYRSYVFNDSSKNALVLDSNGDADYRGTLGTNNGHGKLIFMTGAGTSYGGTNASIERMRIDGFGNVGIGTTNPNSALDVKTASTTQSIGQAYLRNDAGSAMQLGMIGSAASSYGIVNAAEALVYANAPAINFVNDLATGVLKFSAGGASNERMRIAATGNVGIGTTAPSELLNVAKDQNAWTTIKAQNGTVGVSAGATLLAQSDSITTRVTSYSSGASNLGQLFTNGPALLLDAGSAGGYLQLRTGVTPTAKMTILDSGNVGIGTVTPEQKFHVYNTGADTNLAIDSANQSTSSTLLSFRRATTSVWNVGVDNTDAQKFKISTGSGWNNFASGTRLAIDQAGNVGIGTSTANNRLHVQVNNSSSDGIRIDNTNASAQSTILFTNSGTITSTIRSDYLGNLILSPGLGGANLYGLDNTSSSGHVFYGGGAQRMNILANGNVGIGVPGPTYQLQLSTDSAAKPGTSTWTIASDERLKDIRAPFARGLEDLLKLNTIYFRYKANNPLDLPSDKEYVGIRAQDAEKAVPEAVSRDEKGYLHVTNDAIIWTIVNAVKEVYAKVTAADVRIATLEAKQAKLEAENQALRAEAAKGRELASIVKKLQAESEKAAQRLEKLERSGKATGRKAP